MNVKTKVRCWLVWLLLCAAISGQTQSCFPNGIWFFSQQEINEFKVFNPNCKVIAGDVNIDGPDITNLNGLSNITDIQGTLSITGCAALSNLNGLSNLKTLGHFYLAENNALTSIAGLSKLTAVGGLFFIQENAALTNLNGLQNLQTIGSDCWIHYSAALTDISALSGLTSVGGELGLNFATGITNLNALSNLQSVGSISFSWNDALTDISGLQNVAASLDSIAIWGNPNLLSLNGLQQITQTSGPVFLLFNEKLSNLTGLGGLNAVGGKLTVSGHKNLKNLDALASLVTAGSIAIGSNDSLPDLNGLHNLQSVGGDLEITANDALGSLNGLNSLQTLGGKLKIQANSTLTDLSALQNLSTLGGNLELNGNYILSDLNGFGGLSAVGGGILIDNNDQLTNLNGLENITLAGGELFITQNNVLTDLTGLDALQTIGGAFTLSYNPSLTSLAGLQNLQTIGSWANIMFNSLLPDLTGLDQLTSIGDYLVIQENDSLATLAGLEALNLVGNRLAVWNNPALTNVDGLRQLQTIGGNLEFQSNNALLNLDSLELLNSIGGKLLILANYELTKLNGLKNISFIGDTVEIKYNYKLAECSIPPVCQRLFNDPGAVSILSNAFGCQTLDEIEEQCSTVPLVVSLKTDADGDCLPDAGNAPVVDAGIWLSAPGQVSMRPTDAGGNAAFRYFNNGPCFLQPARFPDANWEVCGASSLEFLPGISPDTLTFLLKPKNQCPELTVNLGLPSVFSDCSVESPVSVFVKNSGTTPAQGIQIAVAMPPELDLVSALPLPGAQTGDTLFFQIADLPPLSAAEIRLTVKTKCSGVPPGRALCWSAFGTLANGCTVNPAPISEVKLSAACLGANIRFTLHNIGSASTAGSHTYSIFRNGAGVASELFSLAAGESKMVEVAADGATWRMEATKFEDGTLTAVSHEGCGGFEPGWTTAYWQDKGPLAADFDCRQVADLKTHTGKHAFPAGVGPGRLLTPNQPLRYTIDFHNFEAEAVDVVSLSDLLPPELNINSIRPGASSHPFTWEIRHGNELCVKFDPIHLADSMANAADAHGFFSFDIDQQTDLSDGVVVQNIAETFFWSNFSQGRDTAWHTINSFGADNHKCLPYVEGFGFYTQKDIDDFVANYPGCTEIEGDLVIGLFQNDITNLDGFSQLRAVGGSVRISNCDLLTNLNGLGNLRNIGQGLELGNLGALTALSGLKNLRSIDSLLFIQACHSLQNLQGLDSLRQVKMIEINYNNALSDLTALSRVPHDLFGLKLGGTGLTGLQGLDHLDSIGAGGLAMNYTALTHLNDLNGLEYVAGTLDIGYNFELASLEGLSNLGAVGGDLLIQVDPALASLAGLSQLRTIGGTFMLENQDNMLQPGGPAALQSIGGNLVVQAMSQLENFEGLTSLDSIGGYLMFGNNPNQTTANGLPALRKVGGLNIYVTGMQHLTGFDSLRVVSGDVSIYVMPELLDFEGLGGLETVDGALGVFENPKLKNFAGLGHLAFIGKDFTVNNNATLPNFAGLNNLREIGHQAFFYNNNALTNFIGLDSLRKIGDSLVVFNNPALTSFEGFTSLDTIGDDLWLHTNPALTSLSGFDQLRFIGEDVDLEENPNLTQLTGLEQLETIGADLLLWNYSSISSLSGLNSLEYIGGNFKVPNAVATFSGLDHLRYIGGYFDISSNAGLSNMSGLDSLRTVGGNLKMFGIPNLASFTGMGRLQTIGGDFDLQYLPELGTLHGLNNLTLIGGNFNHWELPKLVNLEGLDNLKTIGLNFYTFYTLASFKGAEKLETIGGQIPIEGHWYLKNFDGLQGLKSLGSFRVRVAPAFESFYGLENLSTLETGFRIDDNPNLTSLNGLENMTVVSGSDINFISGNPKLTFCAVHSICDALFGNNPNFQVGIYNNGPGCDSNAEVMAACSTLPVHTTVLIDQNGDCLPDAGDTPVDGVQVQLSGGNGQAYLRATDAAGVVQYRYFNNGPFTLRLPHFPTAHWETCQADTTFSPGNDPLQDTIKAALLLRPTLLDCPQLEVKLGLPSFLHNCLVASDMTVTVKNTGNTVAESVQLRLIKPLEVDPLFTDPNIAAQAGDTLYFELGDIEPLTMAAVNIRFRTNCNFFLFKRTLCFETSARTLLPCPVTPFASSEIKILPECSGDSMVRFTLKNIGDAPTTGPHRYVVYRNTTPVDSAGFSLAAQQSLVLDFPTDGSTFRVEATKFNDGTLTAAALEHCGGGLTEGMINAFWLDKGPPDYDFDCREVIGSFDPNQKTAVPVGAGQEHFLEANYPLVYTIDFQNTGNDTARRVLLRDILSSNLDVHTFRPIFASHPHTWEIRGVDTLEVLFFPIALPDSNVNEPASHGFFSFEIAQKPDLPVGSQIENTADIIFDFNPPIITNTVWHTIGRLTVRVDAPQPYARLWQLAGNPTRDAATFSALEYIGGEKQFALYDANGRLVQQARFAGQSFEFRRDGLPGGLYFFRISDVDGRAFTGRVVVLE